MFCVVYFIAMNKLLLSFFISIKLTAKFIAVLPSSFWQLFNYTLVFIPYDKIVFVSPQIFNRLTSSWKLNRAPTVLCIWHDEKLDCTGIPWLHGSMSLSHCLFQRCGFVSYSILLILHLPAFQNAVFCDSGIQFILMSHWLWT